MYTLDRQRVHDPPPERHDLDEHRRRHRPPGEHPLGHPLGRDEALRRVARRTRTSPGRRRTTRRGSTASATTPAPTPTRSTAASRRPSRPGAPRPSSSTRTRPASSGRPGPAAARSGSTGRRAATRPGAPSSCPPLPTQASPPTTSRRSSRSAATRSACSGASRTAARAPMTPSTSRSTRTTRPTRRGARARPSSPATNFADDHLNLKADPAGNLFAVVKTSLTSGANIVVLRRSTGGTWTNADVQHRSGDDDPRGPRHRHDEQPAARVRDRARGQRDDLREDVAAELALVRGRAGHAVHPRRQRQRPEQRHDDEADRQLDDRAAGPGRPRDVERVLVEPGSAPGRTATPTRGHHHAELGSRRAGQVDLADDQLRFARHDPDPGGCRNG